MDDLLIFIKDDDDASHSPLSLVTRLPTECPPLLQLLIPPKEKTLAVVIHSFARRCLVPPSQNILSRPCGWLAGF